MIIGIDASRANLKHKTGTEWYSFYVIKNLALIDKKNKYILYISKPASDELRMAVQDNPNFSFKVLNWPFNFFWTLGRLSLEMIFHRPNILFVPAHTLPLFQPRKTITTIHDIAFARESNLYRHETTRAKTRLFRSLINILVKVATKGRYRPNSVDYLHWSTIFALRKAKKIITVSAFTKEEVLRVYLEAKKEKIVVIHNGYNNDLYRQSNDQEKIKQVLDHYGIEQPYLLYVGRLEKKKNSPYLIEAFAILKENHPELKEKLVLIGNAGYGYDEARYVIQEFDLNQEVHMPGWIEEADLPYIYNGATAFVFPSRHEGFGIPVIQALACGLPTAASNLTVFREIAGDAILYFDQNSKQDISRAMYEIATDQNLRNSLAAKGLETVKNFGWEKCARETLEVIESL